MGKHEMTQAEADRTGRRAEFEAGIADQHAADARKAAKAGNHDLAEACRDAERAARKRAARWQ